MKPKRSEQDTKIVSSAHLVSERAGELSEFEYGLIVAGNAFNRWIVRCMSAAGVKDLGVLDILVLHTVNHRGREKRLSDICFVLNVEDTHTVNYALKKLVKSELVRTSKRGKEAFYSATDRGVSLCAEYGQVRETCLVEAISAIGSIDKMEIGGAAKLLRALSGLYDQAARSATSL